MEINSINFNKWISSSIRDLERGNNWHYCHLLWYNRHFFLLSFFCLSFFHPSFPILLFCPCSFVDKEESIPEPVVDEDGNIIEYSISMYGKDWELIRYTIDGRAANCNSGELNRGIAYLAIQRRRNSGRLDHICEVLIDLSNYLSIYLSLSSFFFKFISSLYIYISK